MKRPAEEKRKYTLPPNLRDARPAKWRASHGRRTARAATIPFTFFTIILIVTSARTAFAQVEATQVQQALDQAVDWLKDQQRTNGAWPEWTGFPGGVTALSTLALLHAGLEADDPTIDKALRYLRSFEPNRTYVVALQTMVFAMATPKRDAPLIRRNVRLLESWQIKQGPNQGAWSYGGNPAAGGARGGDNSNAQFAVLALHEAERVGIPVSEPTWKAILKYWRQAQNPNGSWGYQPHTAGRGSMTCAGIASLVISQEKLSDGDAKVVNHRLRCCAAHKPDLAIDRGLDWLGRNFSVYSHPGYNSWLLYYLYGVERAGRLTARRFMGSGDNLHDWYREGAEMLVRSQDKLSGFWKGRGHGEENPYIATSFGVLFLAKGRRPILMAKLQHTGDDWNHHRGDVANLTRYVETRWKEPLAWQIIHPTHATVDDLLQSPVLYLCGSHRPRFTEEEVHKLRAYIDQGGFLFAVACCGGKAFDEGFRKLIGRVFPEPEYALRLLEPDHPVWRAEEPVDPRYLKPLWGIDLGCRTSVIYSPEDLSCRWELARPGRERKLPKNIQAEVQAAKATGINVLAYATNRELRYKEDLWQTYAGEKPEDTVERAKLYIAKLRHTGGWNQAPQALVNLEKTLARETGIRVGTARRDLALTDPRLFDYAVAFMQGRTAFSFSPKEREALRTFVQRGGVLLADSICGSQTFTRSFRREMKLIFPTTPLEGIPADHAMFSTQYGGFDLSTVTRRQPQRVDDGGPLKVTLRKVPPEFEGVRLGDRYGVIFSRYDISCALERHESLQCEGYTRQDAARLALNLVLYALHE